MSTINDELIKMSFSANIVTDFYAQLVPKLMNKYDDEQKVEEILRDFGKRLSRRFYEYWIPESKDFKQILKQTYKMLMRKRIRRVTTVLEGKKWIVIDSNCILCGSGGKSIGNIHYCTLIGALLEGGINYLRKKEGFEHLPKIEAETISSKNHGDSVCKHEIRVVE